MGKKCRELVIRISLLIITVSALAAIYLATKQDVSEENWYVLNDGWQVQINGTVYEDAALDTLSFPAVNKGDVVVLRRMLPQDCPVVNPVFRIYSIHSTVDVKLDQEQLYRYGQELKARGKMLGYGYHNIVLPQDYKGRTIEIRMEITEDNAYTSLHKISICNRDTYLKDYLSMRRVPLAVNLFLMMFGGCLGLVIILFYYEDVEMRKILGIAGFCVGIGIWSLCNYDLMELFTPNLRIKTFLEFIFVYTNPMLVFWYFKDSAMQQKERALRQCYWGIVLVQSALWVLVFACHLLDIVHLPYFLRVEQILMLVMAGYILLIECRGLRQGKVNGRFIMTGVSLMVVFVAYDVIQFLLKKSTTRFAANDFSSDLCIGTLLFVLFLIIDYLQNVSNRIYYSAKNEVLKKMAYTDELTGLDNRRRCEEVIASLGNDGGVYGVLNLDLNDFKTINDTYGHEKGDTVLKDFAAILSEVFGSYGVPGRMGGDEFIVLFPKFDKEKVDQLLEQMEDKIGTWNERNPEVRMSVAYGYSVSDGDVVRKQDVYKLADDQMYKKKQEMKQKMKQGNR